MITSSGLVLEVAQIWLDDVECTGAENFIYECSHPEFGVNNCGHGEDAAVVCQCKLVNIFSII